MLPACPATLAWLALWSPDALAVSLAALSYSTFPHWLHKTPRHPVNTHLPYPKLQPISTLTPVLTPQDVYRLI
jgi:hypothetical protein